MSKIDYRTVEEYQKLLEADPKSRAFAALGEAYRELGMIEEAENLLKRGISFHPKYAAGYVVLGRIYLQKQSYELAIKVLTQAIEFSPDNLLAHQLLGEVHLKMKQPKEALKAHKMAMFLNPQSTRSHQVVKKLETIEAEDFDDDIFEMKPLGNSKSENSPTSIPEVGTPAEINVQLKSQNNAQNEYNLERGLSYIDALIVRHNVPLARQKLLELQNKFPGNAEVANRWKLISDDHLEEAESIRPLISREKQILEQKIEKLRNILAVLANQNQNSL